MVPLTLASLAGPWLLSGAVAIHEVQGRDSHSHLGESGVALAIELVLHGHHHDHGTPAHQHVVAPGRVLPRPVAKASLNGAPRPLGGAPVSPPTLTASGRWSSLARSGAGHDPPSFPGTHSILRI